MFRVRWEDSALNELAALWLSADAAQRLRINAATNQLDRHLESDPAGVGESRSNGRRILFEPPLGITYRIEADGQTVSVLRVWLVRPRSQP